MSPYSSNLLLVFRLSILVGLMVGCAQVPISDNFIPATTTPKKTTITKSENLAKFQASVADLEENYYLGAGDEITIDVWGYPELSGKHTVGPDGKVTLPLAGNLRLTDLSREKAAQTINTALTSFYTGLSIAVRVDKYASNRVLVLGRVSRPGEILFGMTTPTLLEAISKAGGFAEASGLRGRAQSLPATTCAIFRGRDKIVWIELEPLLTGKDLSLNIKLQRNDILYIPDIKEKLVYVLGEVSRPGAFPLTSGMSFLELLAKAGGPTRDAAPGKINVIRPKQGINQPIALSELIAPNQKVNVALEEGDIIYVPTNLIAEINYAIQFLNPFSTMLSVYANIESIRANTQLRKLNQQQERLETERATLEAERAADSGLE
jgi:polysaccharide export outer membrane protein